jgi:hypothetical protein
MSSKLKPTNLNEGPLRGENVILANDEGLWLNCFIELLE